jgi:phenylacetate-CoA ligase
LAKKDGMNIKLSELTHIESKSETLTEMQKKIIEEVFNNKVGNFYGSREFWLIAYSCSMGNLHIVPESVHLEIVNKGEIVKTGWFGDIVITCKVNKTMPLIRYKIGDYGRVNPEMCQCGNKSPIIELQGRNSTEVLTSRGYRSRALLNPLWDEIHKCTSIIQAQIIQNKLDDFTLRYIGTKVGETLLIERLNNILHYLLKKETQLTLEHVLNIEPDKKTGKVQSFIPIKKA